jgi:RNA polymerase primary sigma factor
VAKKRKKKAKQNIPDKVSSDNESSKSAEIISPEQQIKLIIEKGEKKGFLTYEEMNDDLSEDAISLNRLDSLLATLDEMGITLLDEADVESRQAAKAQDEEFETPDDQSADKEKQLKEDELLEKQLVGEEVARRIDDPIRMYLTQMGQIPLLTRKSEIV